MIETDQGHEGPPPPGPRARRAARALIIVTLAGIVGLAAAGGYVWWAMGGTATGKPVRIVVPEGASADRIATLLAEKGVVRSAFVFRLVARVRGAARDLKPGAYDLREGLGVGAAIRKLEEGIPLKVERFTIPEGKTIVEIADIVAVNTHISRARFLGAVRSGRHRSGVLPTGSTNLEGMLFPKTYEIVEKTTADELVDLLLAQFEKETATLDFSRARSLGVTPYEIVIIASLIEKEARLAHEQPKIASVIYNRLNRPMRLEIDATIQYVYILRDGKPKEPLTFEDYELRSNYNTYRIDGLPPTPIAAPGLSAIKAALAPAKTAFYFYRLVDDDGTHCFSTDIQGHNRCAAKRG